MSTLWMRWNQNRWWQTPDQQNLARLISTLADSSLKADSQISFQDSFLEAVRTEFRAEHALLVSRHPDWTILAPEKHTLEESQLPTALLAEALDKEAAGFSQAPKESWLVSTLEDAEQTLLLLSGSRLSEEELPRLLVLSRAAGILLGHLRRQTHDKALLSRLRQILRIAHVCSAERSPQAFLERLAKEATQLIDCERASIFLWDRDQKQLIACPAIGVPGGRLWLPDHHGIVGDVIHSRQTICVDDPYSDPRFDQSVDQTQSFQTKSLLCAPLLDAGGECLGAFELINRQGGAFTDDDVAMLEDLCLQASIGLQNVQELDQLIRSHQQLSEQVSGRVRIVGESPAIVALQATIERLAATDLPVLILGESGTGKEVAAHALHTQGPRAMNPFIAVNCAALTETLLESELFGHEKGAFTDARTTRVGRFELADGGTLFLDEIGDMSLAGQAKLLRVLEQKVITRVGGSVPIPINVRIIAATNTNLAEAVREKRFRQDLYYRLSVVTIELPPLRERPEDVLPLAQHFLEDFCAQAGRPALKFSAEARRRIQAHGWPGNVRELRNLIERLAFLTAGPTIEVEDLAFTISPEKEDLDQLAEGIGLSEATNRFQQDYIIRAVKRVRGNMSEAARLLGLHRSNLYRKMRQLGMEVDDTKP